MASLWGCEMYYVLLLPNIGLPIVLYFANLPVMLTFISVIYSQ